MQRVVLESTTLGSAGHDDQAAVLELQFRNGAVYQYSPVPPQLYRDLLRAESKGRYFNQSIRGRYSYQRIQDVPLRIRP